MKTVVLSKHKLSLAIATAGLSLSLAVGVSAQSPAPTPIVPQQAAPRAAAPVVAPVVPSASTQTSGAVDALEQAARTPNPTAPVAAPAPSSTGYVVPPSSNLGIFEGSSQKLREMAFLKTEVELNKARQARLESMSTLRDSEKTYQDPSYDPKAPKEETRLVDGKAVPAAAPVAIEPQPFVNSVYGYGDQMYAEIIILGMGKVLASKGTVLADGSKVVSVSNNGVVISGKKGIKRLSIRGSASAGY